MVSLFQRVTTSLSRWHATRLVLLGYASYIFVGWLLLCLPFAQEGSGAGALDCLFVATSALSTTGLSPVSTSGAYSFFGELVILALIQLGGIGYMTLGSFVVLIAKTDLSEVRSRIGSTVFSLPAGIQLGDFIRGVIGFTLVIESAGAIALFFVLRATGETHAVWSAIFHSVSSFCTAGFSLYDSSFEGFAGNFWLNAIVAALSFLGAVGFIVCLDFWRVFRGATPRVTLTSKIILWASLWMTVIGTTLIFLSEPSIREAPPDKRLLEAFFQAMTAMTTVGFNTVPIASLSKATVLLVVVLMVIGASPSGTGGGLKSTTLSAIVGVMRSAVRGDTQVRFWGRPIPLERVWTAVASLGFYLSALIVGTYLLEMTEASPFDKNLFEAASALGTVGLSMGITATLTNMGKLVVIALMFCGRLGPLTQL